MGIGSQFILIGALLVVNALLAGSEVALISLRESQIARLEERGARGRAVARLARDPNRFLATVQIGITLSGFLASATAAVSPARFLSVIWLMVSISSTSIIVMIVIQYDLLAIIMTLASFSLHRRTRLQEASHLGRVQLKGRSTHLNRCIHRQQIAGGVLVAVIVSPWQEG